MGRGGGREGAGRNNLNHPSLAVQVLRNTAWFLELKYAAVGKEKGTEAELIRKLSCSETIGKLPQPLEMPSDRAIYRFAKGRTPSQDNLKSIGFLFPSTLEIWEHSLWEAVENPTRAFNRIAQKYFLTVAVFIYGFTIIEARTIFDPGIKDFDYNNTVPTISMMWEELLSDIDKILLPEFIASTLPTMGLRNYPYLPHEAKGLPEELLLSQHDSINRQFDMIKDQIRIYKNFKLISVEKAASDLLTIDIAARRSPFLLIDEKNCLPYSIQSIYENLSKGIQDRDRSLDQKPPNG